MYSIVSYMEKFVLIVFIILIVLCLWCYPKTKSIPHSAIRKLTRQTARWLIASQQDRSPMIAFLHLQYGMGYLWAIKDIVTPEEFHKATGEDWLTFEGKALKIQDELARKMAKACPQFIGDVDLYLGRIAGDR